MSVLWINKNEMLAKGINLINSIENPKFTQFITRIVDNISKPSEKIFTTEEITKLGAMFQMNDNNSTVLVVKSLQHILKKIAKYIFKPKNLEDDLKQLGFNDDKSDTLVKIWLEITRDSLKSVALDKLSDNCEIKSQVCTQLSSSNAKEFAVPKAFLSLDSGSEKIDLECSHKELHSLFLVLEVVQNELDILTLK